MPLMYLNCWDCMRRKPVLSQCTTVLSNISHQHHKKVKNLVQEVIKCRGNNKAILCTHSVPNSLLSTDPERVLLKFLTYETQQNIKTSPPQWASEPLKGPRSNQINCCINTSLSCWVGVTDTQQERTLCKSKILKQSCIITVQFINPLGFNNTFLMSRSYH